MTFMKSQKWSARDTKKCIVIPSDLDHKYSRGTLGVITGSAQYPGAAVLTTRAATATGLGVLRFHSSSGLAHLVLHSTPEALVQPGKVDAWVAGSGISEKKYSDYTTWLRHRWFKLIKTFNDWFNQIVSHTCLQAHKCFESHLICQDST